MDNKDIYEEKLKAQLAEWRAEIDKLEAKAEAARADAKIVYERELEELRQKQKIAQERFEEIQKAQGEAWRDMRKGIESAWDELGDAVRHALKRFT